jgi:hypothetical protein
VTKTEGAGMSRYYVIDSTCSEYEDEVLPGYRGELLGIFNTIDSAEALAQQRTATGSARVLVVDSTQGEQVYPAPPSTDNQQTPTNRSETRLRQAPQPPGKTERAGGDS